MIEIKRNPVIFDRVLLNGSSGRTRTYNPAAGGINSHRDPAEIDEFLFFDLAFQSDGIGSVRTFDLMYQAPWPFES